MNRSTLLPAISLLALITAAASAHADDLSYNYLEVRYAEADLDDGFEDIDGDGFVLNGSLEFSDSLHVFVGYDTLEFADGVDISTTVFGGGFALPLSGTTDLVLRAGVFDAELDTPLFTADDQGGLFSVGFRTLVRDDIELYGEIKRLEFDDAGREQYKTLGAEFYLNDGFSIGPSVTWVEDTRTWTLGGRFYF